jgi:hypothetical protein
MVAPVALANPPALVVGISFYGATPTDAKSKGIPSPTLVGAVIRYPERDRFGFALLRLSPKMPPSPDARLRIEVLKEANLTWPDVGFSTAAVDPSEGMPSSAEPDGTTAAGEAPATAAASATAAAGAAAVATPASSEVAMAPPAAPLASPMPLASLIGLEAMPSSGGGGGGSRGSSKGSKRDAAFMALRSDGVIVTLSMEGTVLNGVSTGVTGLRRAVRSASTIALLTPERLVLIELTRRAPPRECALPEATLSSGGRLTGLAFDQHVNQLLYASTSDGATMVFNRRARAAPPPPEDTGGARGGIECRWLDTLVAPPGRSDEAATSLAAVRGYLFSVGTSSLQARNVSTIYHTAEPETLSHVYLERLPPPPPFAYSCTYDTAFDGEGTDASLVPTPCTLGAASSGRLLMASGSSVLVEGGADETGAASGGGIGSHVLRFYQSSLPYEPPAAPLWPKILMGGVAVAITAFWQLYRRSRDNKKKSKAEADSRFAGRFADRGGRTGGRRPGHRNFDDDGGIIGGGLDAQRRAAAASHYEAHARNPAAAGAVGREKLHTFEDDGDDYIDY